MTSKSRRCRAIRCPGSLLQRRCRKYGKGSEWGAGAVQAEEQHGTLAPMRLATFRRFAFVAIFALLEPLWGHSATTSTIADEASGASPLTHLSIGTAPVQTSRQHLEDAWQATSSRLDQSRVAVVLSVGALLWLLRLIPWTVLASVLTAGSSLIRRRYVIALRAPPAFRCT